MEQLIHHVAEATIDIWNNLPVIAILSGFFGWLFHRIIKGLNKDVNTKLKNVDNSLLGVQLTSKRMELLQAIDHDYGLAVASKVFDDYKDMGGNSYAEERYNVYKE